MLRPPAEHSVDATATGREPPRVCLTWGGLAACEVGSWRAVEERFVRAPLSLPPDLWAEFKQPVPARGRSGVAAEALRREIRRRRRLASKESEE